MVSDGADGCQLATGDLTADHADSEDLKKAKSDPVSSAQSAKSAFKENAGVSNYLGSISNSPFTIHHYLLT